MDTAPGTPILAGMDEKPSYVPKDYDDAGVILAALRMAFERSHIPDVFGVPGPVGSVSGIELNQGVCIDYRRRISSLRTWGYDVEMQLVEYESGEKKKRIGCYRLANYHTTLPDDYEPESSWPWRRKIRIR